MKVLLTGASGFLGSRVAGSLVKAGVEVRAVVRTSSDTWRLADLADSLELVRYEAGGAGKLFEDSGPISAVIHTATCYGRKGENWDVVAEANLVGPAAILDAGAAAGVPWFINTDTFFPRGHSGLSHYVESKKRFVDEARGRAHAGSIKLINVILHHAYGPADSEGKFIPWLIGQFLDDVPEVDLTEGSQKRDFVYVDDAADAFAALAGNLKRFTGREIDVQLGSGDPSPVREVVELLKRYTGARTRLNYGVIALPKKEPEEISADITLLSDLGWNPAVKIEEGMKRTVEWFSERGKQEPGG
jgi:nucleoside-diphosphate-sugar epimerase